MFDTCVNYDISEKERKKFFLKKTNNVRIVSIIDKSDNLIFKPKSFDDLQKAVNRRMPLGVIDTELLFEKNNMHYLKSGVDDTIAKIMGSKKIALVFDLKLLLDNKGEKRSIIISRMKKNMKYAIKYGVPVLFASRAKNKYELFNGSAIRSIGREMGLKDWKWAVKSYSRSVEES